MVDFPVDIVYSLKDNVSGAVGGIKSALQSVDSAIQDTASSFNAMSEAASVAGGVLLADVVSGLADSATAGLELGAQMQALNSSFNSLLEQAGATSLTLDSLRSATKGTVSDVDLLTAANKALSLGLPVDDLDSLFGSALKLGRVMGIDTLNAVDSLATGIGRQSVMILDNLGVTFAAAEAYEWYAAQLGVSTKELDDNQKKLAWQQYAIEQVSVRAAELGDIQDEAVTAQEQWTASIVNAQTAVGGFLGPLANFKGAFEAVIPVASAIAVTVLPQMVAAFGVAGAAEMAFASATYALKGALDFLAAHPIILVITGIAAALVAAYNACPPFRDAINAIGKALGESLGVALETVKNGLEWLWNNVFVPFGEFLYASFMPTIQLLSDVFTGLGDIFGAVADVLGGAWNTLTSVVSADASQIADATKDMGSEAESNMNRVVASIEGLADSVPIVGSAVGAMRDTILGFTGQTETYYMAWRENSLATIDAALQDQLDSITRYYDEALAAVDSGLQQELDSINMAYTDALATETENYRNRLAEFETFWSDKYVEQETALDKALESIRRHYEDERREVIASYDEQIDATNRFYDDLQAATDAGLKALRDMRNKDLDELELNFLLQKRALEESLEAKRITQEEYEEQMSTIEREYRDKRSRLSDDYRIQELQLEQEHAEQSAIIAEQRKEAVTSIETEKAAALIDIVGQQNMDLEAAQKEYNRITEEHKQELQRIETTKAEETKAAVDKAEAAKNVLVQAKQGELNNAVKTAEAEKQKIIEESNRRIKDSTDSWWSQIGGSIRGACDSIVSWASSAWSQVSNIFGNIAAAASSALSGAGKWLGNAVSGIGSVLGFAEGGVVTQPTYGLIGEAGYDEAVIPLNEYGYAQAQRIFGVTNRGIQINSPLVVIEGNADEATAYRAAQLVNDELNRISNY